MDSLGFSREWGQPHQENMTERDGSQRKMGCCWKNKGEWILGKQKQQRSHTSQLFNPLKDSCTIVWSMSLFPCLAATGFSFNSLCAMHGSWFQPQHLPSSVSAFYLLQCECFMASLVTYPNSDFKFFMSSLDLCDKCVPLISNVSLELPYSCVTFTSNSTCYKPSISTVPQNQNPTELPQSPRSLKISEVHHTQLSP